MAIIDLSVLKDLFGSGKVKPEDKQKLLQEALLLTLARASRSDTNIHPAEIDTIQTILKQTTGRDFSEADIRVAAHSELYEQAPLEDYLKSISNALDEKDCVLIANSLADVIKSDKKVTYQEVAFFNGIATALKMTPASMVGLFAND